MTHSLPLRTDLAVGELAVHVVADAPPDLPDLAHAAQPQLLHVVTALGGAPAPAHDVRVFCLLSLRYVPPVLSSLLLGSQ